MCMYVCLCWHVSVCVCVFACACACMLHTRVALPQMEVLLIWGADSVSMIDWFGFSAYDHPFPRRKISIKSGAEKSRYYTMTTENDLGITAWFSDVSTELGPFGWENHVFSGAGNFSFNFWHYTRHSGYEMWQMKRTFTFWYMDNWVISSVLTQQSPEDQTPPMSLCHIVLRRVLCPLQHICASTHQFQMDRFLFHRQKGAGLTTAGLLSPSQNYFNPPHIYYQWQKQQLSQWAVLLCIIVLSFDHQKGVPDGPFGPLCHLYVFLWSFWLTSLL